MKLVRIDAIGPGGRALELHPRLTVLRGVGPEMRRRLEQVVRSIAESSSPEVAGVIEVSGVHLSLERETLAQLDLDMVIDPVLVVSDHGQRRVGGSQLHSDRDRLTAVHEQRTALGARLEVARARLDPYANAALQTCIGQIEAQERRRASLRAEWERERRSFEDERTRASSAADTLRAALASASAIDPAPVLTARAGLVAAMEAPMDQDSDAVALADLLDQTLDRLRALQAHRSQIHIRCSEAEQRLSEARIETREATASMRSPDVDRDSVQRLEAVRDEIFFVDDRSGRFGSGRNKRKLQELRAEQAILLDRLGFDTYSAYVMGIPSTRSELERSARAESAQDRVERIEQEIARLRSQGPDPEAVERVEAELQTLLVRAQRHVGPNDDLAVPLDVGGPHSADLIYETIAALRRHRLAAPGAEDRAVSRAMGELRRFLVVPTWPSATIEHPGPPSWSEAGAFERLGAAELLARADEWLAWHRELRSWSERAASELASLEHPEHATVPGDGDRAVNRWAQVETELDAALDGLAEAEERCRRHDEATAEIAELRSEELRLRGLERALLESVAEAARATSPADGSTPPPFRNDAASPEIPSPEMPSPDPHWAIVSSAARQRKVSFVGALPMLVIDVDGRCDDAACIRLRRLSDLIQIIVVTDDRDLATRLACPGSAVAVVEAGVPGR